jgi:hypothetical protein
MECTEAEVSSKENLESKTEQIMQKKPSKNDKDNEEDKKSDENNSENNSKIPNSNFCYFVV